MNEAPARPFVSVIVPVFNDTRVGQCLAALERQTYPAERYEIIVVDNGSTPAVALPPGTFGHARVLREITPGVERARATGLLDAKGEVFAFTDADCLPEDAWLDCGVHRLQADPRCGIVGGRIQMVLDDAARPTLAARLSEATHLKQERFVARGRWAAAANLFTSRRVVEQVGSINATLVGNGEVEWAHRVTQAGFTVAYAPDAVVRHPARASLRSLFDRTMRMEASWSQLRMLGLGRGWRRWIGQYLVRPLIDTYGDIVRHPHMTWSQKLSVSALAASLIAFRVAVYALMRIGWRIDLRRHWG